MGNNAFEDYIREWQEKYGDMTYSELLREANDTKPMYCKYLECVSCGPLGKIFFCMNKNSEYYLKSSSLCCVGMCGLYEKENTENE